MILKSLKTSEKLNKISSLAASEYIAKSVFIYWLCIHKFCLKRRFALQILKHETGHKLSVQELTF